MSNEIENFFGVYLLCCRNEKYKGHTYIGFTVDPNRRIKQHNTGTQAGGAHRTSGRGPWEMVLIIHGFPNRISALRFEWAWQNPKKSKRLRHCVGKRQKKTGYAFRFRLVCEMLRTSPWNRLPLTIRWLKQEHQLQFDPTLLPPTHMPIQFGPVKPVKIKPTEEVESGEGSHDLPVFSQSVKRCGVCHAKMIAQSSTLKCINSSSCTGVFHTKCLALQFLSQEGVDASEIVPVQGACPQCQTVFLWGDLVRFKHGCYRQISEKNDALLSQSSQSHWTDELG